MFCERYWHKTVPTTISLNFISASPRFLIDHVIFPCSWSMQQTTNVIVLGFFVDNKWEKVISKCYWIFFELRTTLEIERHVNIDRGFFCYHVSRRISFETFQVVAFFPPRFHWLQGKVAMSIYLFHFKYTVRKFAIYRLPVKIWYLYLQRCIDRRVNMYVHENMISVRLSTLFRPGTSSNFLCVYITYTLVSYVEWKI